MAQVYLEFHSFLKEKIKTKLLTLTHQRCLANMPLGKYLEYIMEQEKSENKNVTAQRQYAAASGNNELLLILQSVCVGDA